MSSVIPILYKSFQELEGERILPNLFCPILIRQIYHKKNPQNYGAISLMNIDRTFLNKDILWVMDTLSQSW